MLTFSTIQTDRGVVYNINASDRNSVFILPTAILEHSAIGKPLQAVSNAIDSTFAELSEAHGDLSEQGYRKKSVDLIRRRIAPKWNELRDEIQGETVSQVDRFKNIVTPVEPSNGVELRVYARTLKPGELIAYAKSNPAMLNAIVAGGKELSGLNAEIFNALENELHVQNAMAIFHKQRSSEYTLAPTVSDPVGGAIDTDRLRSDALALVQGMTRQGEIVQSARETLARMLHAVATAGDLPAEVTLSALIDGDKG